MTGRAFACEVCGAAVSALSLAPPTEGATELLQMQPGAWAATVREDDVERMAVACSNVCAFEMVRQ